MKKGFPARRSVIGGLADISMAVAAVTVPAAMNASTSRAKAAKPIVRARNVATMDVGVPAGRVVQWKAAKAANALMTPA